MIYCYDTSSSFFFPFILFIRTRVLCMCVCVLVCVCLFPSPCVFDCLPDVIVFGWINHHCYGDDVVVRSHHITPYHTIAYHIRYTRIVYCILSCLYSMYVCTCVRSFSSFTRSGYHISWVSPSPDRPGLLCHSF